MKRQPPKRDDKPAAAPTFRPMEAQLKKLAAEKKLADAAAKKASAPIASGARGAPTAAIRREPEKQAPRASSLTRDEQRELAAMEGGARDDDFMFRRLMAGVVPIEESRTGRITTAKEPKQKPRAIDHDAAARADDQVREHLMSLVEGSTRFEVTDDGARLEARRLDLGDSTWRRVRRGELPIDARLDLHGMMADEARAAIELFLAEKRARKDRMVLVIHGRGEHSPAGIGVLRGEIAAWLSQGRASQHVAAFATARDADGGRGALYVLLRP